MIKFNQSFTKYFNFRVSSIVIGAIALTIIMHSTYIPAKAWLSQELIAYSWKTAQANNSPVEPWPWADTTAIAKMNIERLDKSIVLLKGTDPTTLAFSAGVMHQYAKLTKQRPFVIAGHRDTHFSFLQHIALDDVISINDIEGNQSTYKVNDINIIDSNTTPLLLNENESTLVLITCYPFNAMRSGGSLRYMISATKLTV